MTRVFGIRHIRQAFLVLSFSGLMLLPQGAQAATLTFSNMKAVFSTATDSSTGGETLSLLVDSSLFGTGGFASGQCQVGVPPDPCGPSTEPPPDDNRWLVGPFGGPPPDDNTPVLTFNIDPAGEVSGVEPSPFRLFVEVAGTAAGGPLLFGELDFSSVTGSLGSLNLANVLVHEVDATTGERTGTVFDVNPFTIQPVPIPAALPLLGGGLGLLERIRFIRGHILRLGSSGDTRLV